MPSSLLRLRGVYFESVSSRLLGKTPRHLFIWMDENGSVALPDPRFRLDLGFHPSGEPRSSPAPRGALGESGRNESAGNAQKTSRAGGVSDLSARKADRRPHRIVFRAL
jgi:hypothetical protein